MESIRMRLPAPPLLVISDRRQAHQPLEEIAEAVFASGCRWFSLREKDLPPQERLSLLTALVERGRSWGATVTIHDDIEAAVVANAGGVHLPSGANPKPARERLPCRLIGASAHSAEEAAAQLRAGADYVTVSPIFVTASKPGYGPALGLDGLACIAKQVAGPLIALGGISAENAALCLSVGAQGVAVMGEVMRASDPRAVVEGILDVLAAGN
jgi:thiamine-phosphate pyrophosphorylase